MKFTRLAIIAIAAMANICSANAGGLLTNTNQSASYVRNFSQNANIDITGLYANPAGTAFLSDGWHMSFNVQSAYQTRVIDTTFPLFQLNTATPSATHNFKGKASVPVLPSFQVSYNKGKWSLNAAFAVTGGGGKCEFDNGLGSFESLYSASLYSQIPTAVNALVKQQAGATLPGMVQSNVVSSLVGMGIPQQYAEMIAGTTQTSFDVNSQMTGYSLDAYMKGRQYYFGLTLGGTYKFRDNLAGFFGIRGVYANCNYNGFVQDVKANYAYTIDYKYDVPANALLGFPGAQGEGQLSDQGTQELGENTLALNTDQTGFGITPIIGIDWRINKHWNVAAKYEFKTRMRLNNSSEMNEMAKSQAAQDGNVLSQFADGKSVAEDIPAVLAYGVQYSPVEAVRISAGMNIYFDKNATKYANKHELIDKNATEILAGAEYDVTDWLTLSASWQKTNYGLSDAYMNDLSFNLSSNSIGAGIRVKATKRCSIDAGYMQTFYKDRSVTTKTAAGNKTDLYSRTNRVFAVGVNLAI